MHPDASQILENLRSHLRRVAIAQIGGFRPPEDPRTSWFGRGVGLPDESLPTYQGKEMFPLLQINVAELPFVPPEFATTRLLVVYFEQEDFPFDKPHGEGWLIREYASLDHLVLLPSFSESNPVRPFPIRWSLIEDDAPGWEDAWSVLDMSAVNEDDEASDSFFYDFSRYSGTKVGGYPKEIQHGVGLKDYVFQIGSETKPGWNWVDDGIAYFFKSATGEWRWDCQFY